MASIGSLKKALKDYESEPDSYAQDLKNSFAGLLLRLLRDNGWTQKELASKSGVGERIISRIVHADHDCSFETLGQLLFALRTRVAISKKEPETS